MRLERLIAVLERMTATKETARSIAHVLANADPHDSADLWRVLGGQESENGGAAPPHLDDELRRRSDLGRLGNELAAFGLDLAGIAHDEDRGLGLDQIRVIARAAIERLNELTEASADARLPPPMSVADLLAVEEPSENDLVRGLIPAGGNLLLAAYPKSYKTFLVLELAVSLATGTRFLGRFEVPKRRRTGIVLMEDADHRTRRRLERLCIGRGTTLEALKGWLHFWFGPPLRLNDRTVRELGGYATDLALELLWVDSWSYVATGDSNKDDNVRPQLTALSACRMPQGGTVGLTHHARKDRGDAPNAARLTDIIRNSGMFGAWYDCGLVLARTDERSPTTVRVELRNDESPAPFAFEVLDETPRDPVTGRAATGWLRLIARDETPQTVEREANARKLVPAVRELLRENPDGLSRTSLRSGVPGANEHVEAAFGLLVAAGEAELIPSPGRGLQATYRLKNPHPAEPCRNPAAAGLVNHPADPAATPEGGRQGQGSRVDGNPNPARQGSGGFTCSAGCGAPVGRAGIACARCQYGDDEP